MKTILVATDGSAPAGRAVVRAADIAKALGARLVILTVTVIDPDLRRFADAEHGALGDILQAEARKQLSEAHAQIVARGLGTAETRYAIGDPADLILRTAAELKADLIVVGKRGRGPLTGLLLGSVSQKLVSLSPTAVMVVP